MAYNVVLVEDDPVLRDSMIELLGEAGYLVCSADSVSSARRLLPDGKMRPHIYLIDVMLPDGSGLDLCREIRACEDTPVICVTALDDEESVINGLGAGADDYITKPFRARELLARVAANIRRAAPEASVLESGAIRYSSLDERVFVDGEERTLRKTERALLKLFLESGGRLLKREYILYRLWDREENYVEENTLSVLVSRLRKSIAAENADSDNCIETVRGIGYRWRLPVRKRQG